MLLRLALDKLVGRKVHALPEGCSDECVGDGHEAEVLGERRGLRVEEDDGHVGERRVFAVDARDDL